MRLPNNEFHMASSALTTFNALHSGQKFNRRHFGIFLSYFPEKIGINISCNLGDNLNEMSKPIF